MEKIRMQHHVCILSSFRDQTHKGTKCMGVLVGLAKYATPEQEQKDIDISPEE